MNLYEKPQYEKDVDEFVEADKAYTELEGRLTSGSILREIFSDGTHIDRAIEEYKLVLEEMRKMLDDRNTKLRTAKNSLRSAVQLGPLQWRGPDGKATTLAYGPFTASSFTKRSIDPQTLLELAKVRGFENEVLGLRGIDKDGKEYTLVETRTEVDYSGIITWLKQRKLDDVIEGAYDEKEGTPTVKGPKPLAFLGEKKDE